MRCLGLQREVSSGLTCCLMNQDYYITCCNVYRILEGFSLLPLQSSSKSLHSTWYRMSLNSQSNGTLQEGA